MNARLQKGREQGYLHDSPQQLQLIALALVGLSAMQVPRANAADECGTGTTVICTSSNNPYPNGVSYNVPNINLTLASGANVDTTGGNPPTNASFSTGFGQFTTAVDQSIGGATVTVEQGASITTSQSGIRGVTVRGSVDPGSTVVVVNNGNITMSGSSGGVRGIYVFVGGNISVANTGSINQTAATAGSGIYAQVRNGGSGTITIDSSGTVNSAGTGIVAQPEGSSVDNVAVNNSGTVQAGGIGINTSATGTLDIVQTGTVSAGSTGVVMTTGSSPGTLQNSGTITGGADGVTVSNSGHASVTNTGTIEGTSGTGLLLTSSSGPLNATNSGAGLITGVTGISVLSGDNAITNTATITGTGGTAVSITGSNNALILGTGSVLNGGATSTGTGNTLQLQGSGSEDSNLTGFSSLTMSGTAWTLSGANSTTGATAAATNVRTGTLTITGTLTNTGAGGGTTIASGATLQVGNGGAGGSVSGDVLGNGTLAGTGVINGNVTAPGILSPGALGNVPGTLTIDGNLALTGSSVLNYSLGEANVVNGPLNDLTVVGGNLTLGGTLNVQTSPGGSFDPGVYRIISYGGTLTDNGLAVGTVPSPNYYLLTTLPGQVDLVNTNGMTLDYWDGDAGPPFNGVVDGGNGTWQGPSGLDNWTERTGTVNAPYANGAFAIFAGAPGTVTADNSLGAIVSSGMQFLTSGYLIQGGPITLAAGTDTIRVGDGTEADARSVATIAAALTGSGALNKADLGTLILTGTNTYTGGTSIESGTLQLGNGGTTGSIPTGSVTDNGTLAFDRSDALTFSGVISGAGAVSQRGTGSTTLTADNTYQGGTTIEAGTLQLGDGGTTGSITGNVADNGTLASNRSDAVTLAGVISGTGAVSQNGAGSTTLGGVNTYSGGTTISGGTLTGSATSFGSGAILDNAALVIDQPVNASFANAINGAGTLTKSGAGALNLTGTSALTGPTTVAAGLLSVNGALAHSAVTVQSGATLGGDGTVGSTTILSGGTVAPGNSIGTLTVNGNFSQAAGSTYQVEVNPGSTASDLIQVNGVATLASGAVINVTKDPAGPYTLGSRYTVLTTTNGLTGTYTVTGDTALSAFYGVAGSYAAHNAYLSITQQHPFVDAAQTPNETATAQGLQSLPDTNALKNAVGSLANDAQARTAFDQLSGEVHSSILSGLIDQSGFVRNAATDRVQQAFCAVGGTNSNIKTRTAGAQPATSSCNPDRIVVWTRAFGSWGHTNSNGNAATMNTSIGGAFFGADARVFDSWRVGMLAGYSHSDFTVDERNSSGLSNNYDLGVYGGTQWGNLGLRMGMAYTWHNIDTSRSVSFSGYTDQLGASYHAGTFQLFGDLGYRINAGPVGVEPFVSLAYVHLSTDGFTEQGGAAALTSGSESYNSTFSTLGVRAASTFAAGNLDLTAKGMLGWRHAWGNVTPASTLVFSGSNAFTVAGVPIARDVAVIEAGLEAPIGRNGTVGVSYVGQMGSGMQNNGIRGDLSWKF